MPCGNHDRHHRLTGDRFYCMRRFSASFSRISRASRRPLSHKKSRGLMNPGSICPQASGRSTFAPPLAFEEPHPCTPMSNAELLQGLLGVGIGFGHRRLRDFQRAIDQERAEAVRQDFQSGELIVAHRA
jgi:hypothetical protein